MSLPKTIVVPIDFSTLSLSALKYASELAKVAGRPAGPRACRRRTDRAIPRLARLRTARATADDARALGSGADRRARGFREPSRPDATGVVLTTRAPAEAIVSYARDAHADLIVMGTHGRNAVGRLLLGSVAERVVRTAPCPVLTVREAVRHDAQDKKDEKNAVPA